MTIIDALHRRELFAPLFKTPATWRAWGVYLRALSRGREGLPGPGVGLRRVGSL